MALPDIIHWKLVSVSQGRTSCEHCGHAIKNIFTIQASTGIRKEVGSECVLQLLDSADKSTAELIDRRLTRAAKQWRDNKPAVKLDETREQYIARRVIEMGHALSGFKATMAIDWYGTAVKQARERGVPVDLNAAYDEMHTAIEQKYQANRFDYNRPIWQVRKV